MSRSESDEDEGSHLDGELARPLSPSEASARSTQTVRNISDRGVSGQAPTLRYPAGAQMHADTTGGRNMQNTSLKQERSPQGATAASSKRIKPGPLSRLASFSQGAEVYDQDGDSDADLEAVQAELGLGWTDEHQRPESLRNSFSSNSLKEQPRGDQQHKYSSRNLPDRLLQQQQQQRDNSGDSYHRHQHNHTTVDAEDQDDSDGESLMSHGSYTLKDRQDAINIAHPFGLKIWKPALYKKDRSVQKAAEGEIHSKPGRKFNARSVVGNILWTLVFGWWLSLVSLATAVPCYLTCSRDGSAYGRVLLGLSHYLFYPFGKFVELNPEEAYAEEDEGVGRNINDYNHLFTSDHIDSHLFSNSTSNVNNNTNSNGHNPQHRNYSAQHNNIPRSYPPNVTSDGEIDPLLQSHEDEDESDMNPPSRKRRLFGRGRWSIARIVFFALFYFVITPMLLLVASICWLLVFTLPMSKISFLLFTHLRRHPLSLSFHSDLNTARQAGSEATVLACTHRSMGFQYYKYTVDGINIFFVNLMALVFLTIFDEYVLHPWVGNNFFLTSSALIFSMALVSIIPLAYFIGMAVASISAQSSMGMGAAINAFFGSIVEVFLYSVALSQGKARLTEGSVVGSIFAGCLLMPGCSMMAGAFVRKTQSFNAKSAGVTSTMLLFAIIGAFAPTLFYQIYGTYELTCSDCSVKSALNEEDCQRCSFDQGDALKDVFYQNSVKPFSYFCAVLLFISYIVGLWFTLRTHAQQIWHMSNNPGHDENNMRSSITSLGEYPRRESYIREVRNSSMFKQIVPTLQHSIEENVGDLRHRSSLQGGNRLNKRGVDQNISGEDRTTTKLADVAATAATIAVQSQIASTFDFPSPVSPLHHTLKSRAQSTRHTPSRQFGPPLLNSVAERPEPSKQPESLAHGHDAPNWSRTKSYVVLLGATILYAIIAEVLVDTVDVVLTNVVIDEKFLGFTLFALVPNTTEFLNAISFALNGNIALSMEIGSAYALQVCLLQIPALVAVSAIMNRGIAENAAHTFSLMFPRWDLVTIILTVFLLSYMYGEGKSNYFKGSILLLTYVVICSGFFYAPSTGTEIVYLTSKASAGRTGSRKVQFIA